MGDTGSGITDYPILVLTFIVGATVLVIVYISSLLKSSKQEEKTKTSQSEMVQKEKSGPPPPPTKSSKKKHEKWGRDSKQTFSHPWLLTSLKGHTGSVLDMDFSSNGKFLATCAEDTDDLDPGGEISEQASGNSSGSEATKNSPSPSSRVHGLTRRQKKNHRVRREDDSPTPQPVNWTAIKKSRIKARRSSNSSVGTGKRGSFCASVLKQYTKLNLSDADLSIFLRYYLLSADHMLQLGYPMESSVFPGKAIILKNPSTFMFGGLTMFGESSQYTTRPLTSSSNLFDVNAREFIPMSVRKSSDPHCTSQEILLHNLDNDRWEENSDTKEDDESNRDLPELSNTDKASEESSSSCSQELSSESDYSDSLTDLNAHDEQNEKCYVKPPSKHNLSNYGLGDSNLPISVEKKCARCQRGFFLTEDGEYLTQEHCLYHWGKLQNTTVYPDPGTGKCAFSRSEYSCCHGKPTSKGCTTAKLHVWTGLDDGYNGPLDHYVRTRYRKTPPPDGNYGVYGVDCEMSFTTHGLELVKVTVVGADGRIVYDALVKPENSIIDYNTRFSGISARDFSKRGVNAKSLREVQNDLMGFINADTILIGHGLENDLRALRIMHTTVVDTSVVFPHYNGLPYRRSLKTLADTFLKQNIQQDSTGHNSFEDARACVELMLWRVRKDFRTFLDTTKTHQNVRNM